jgi:hypothetical protein
MLMARWTSGWAGGAMAAPVSSASVEGAPHKICFKIPIRGGHHLNRGRVVWQPPTHCKSNLQLL